MSGNRAGEGVGELDGGATTVGSGSAVSVGGGTIVGEGSGMVMVGVGKGETAVAEGEGKTAEIGVGVGGNVGEQPRKKSRINNMLNGRIFMVKP